MQSIHAMLPAPALAAFLVFVMVQLSAVKPGGERGKPGDWRFAALLGGAFAAWTGYAVMTEGLFGFWPAFSRDAWANQVWFDFLLSFGIAWSSLALRARQVGMHLLPWTALFVLTGSIGLMAMLARCLFLENRTRPAVTTVAA